MVRPIALFCILFPTVLHAQGISVYFNQSVDHSASSLTDAISVPVIEDSIVRWIDSAHVSLDVAVWDNGSTAICNAINAALARGVQIRYITSSNALNSGLSMLDSSIPILERSASITANVMHNKFIVLDRKTVVTGSMNFGMGSMQDDYNNVVVLRDSSLAAAYTSEFVEMWGGDQPLPNLQLSLFGPAKLDNTTHNFTVTGTAVECYFSPTDQATSHIVDAINTANHSLDIAMFTFIHNDLGDAVVAAHQRGVLVRCIIENTSYLGSEFGPLVNAGVPTHSHATMAFDLHHKYCIIDADQPASDPVVITGSHNWTNSAEDEYDENTLVLHEHLLAQQFKEEFSKRWNETNTSAAAPIEMRQDLVISPNPVKGHFQIANCPAGTYIVEILSLQGKQLYIWTGHCAGKEFEVNLPNGLYMLRIFHTKGSEARLLLLDREAD